jgi:ABC-type multidrug transport system ATPase subunit
MKRTEEYLVERGKRVSIGVDMIHDPPILLLDEPTSGLDNISAFQVIELLSSMAKGKERTVILSIHQPSYRILQYIKNFLILSRGSAVHNGSLESLEETINKLGFQIPCDRICHGNYVYTRGFIFQKVPAYFELCSYSIIYKTKQLFLARTMQAIVGGGGGDLGWEAYT